MKEDKRERERNLPPTSFLLITPTHHLTIISGEAYKMNMMMMMMFSGNKKHHKSFSLFSVEIKTVHVDEP